MDKREDHPLWAEFLKWMGSGNPLCEGWRNMYWPAFLAGGEAMKAFLPKLVEAAHVTPRCKVLADRLTTAVERLEELGKCRPLYVHPSWNITAERLAQEKPAYVHPSWHTDPDRLTTAVERLENLADIHAAASEKHLHVTERLEELTKRHERMGLMVTVTENADVTLGGLHKG